MNEAPLFDVDIFSSDSVRDANAVDDALREAAPVVRLPDGTIMIARHEHVSAGLLDWKSFSSSSRPWHDPTSVRPEILLVQDPPEHGRPRKVMADLLSPNVLDKAKAGFRAEARLLVDELLAREGEEIDAVSEITQRYVYKILPDLIGIPLEGREHMTGFGNMVWATMGPMNALFESHMVGIEPVIEWVETCCNRENLTPDGLGMQLFLAADAGQITHEEAKLLAQIVLSAAADTTVITLANTIRAFCDYPDQYARIRANPALARQAFDESLRWDSPSRMAGRVAMEDVEVGGITVPKGSKCGLMFGAANRDPRRWEKPEAYDLDRNLKHQLGWGYGVHACVGRLLANLEAVALLTEFAERIESFEAAGPPEPWMQTIGHGPARLPVRVRAR